MVCYTFKQTNSCCVQADLCYVSAFDDAEEPAAAAPASDYPPHVADNDEAGTESGMLEVASAPALLMLAGDEELVLMSEALSDLSLGRHHDEAGTESGMSPSCRVNSRPAAVTTDGKPTQAGTESGITQQRLLDNAFYFYQG